MTLIVRSILLLTVALLVSAKLSALEPPPAFPDTSPGKLMSEWLRLFNDGDPQKLEAFIQAHYGDTVLRGRSPQEIVEGQLQMREGTGSLQLALAEKSSPGELTAILESGGVLPQFLSVTWRLVENDPQRIAASTFQAGAPPASAGQGKLPLDQLGKDLDPKLEELARRDQFSGAVIIAREGKPVWQKAVGFADREKKIPATLETRFRLGSMPKMFTSVAIAQLAEAGKLKFTDTVATVLPDYPNKEVAQKVTVEQLLNHTSGLGDIFTARFDELKDKLRDVKDYLPLFVSEPLKFEPGKDRSYSNAGFIVLGLIIEKISGENYYDYIQRHIFDKAGMKNTGNIPTTERPAKLAVGYMKRAGKL